MGYVKDSYRTTIGSHLITKDIENAIKEAIIRDNIDSVNLNVISDGSYKMIFITGIFPSEANIPLFAHPIIIENFKGHNYLCSDIRLFINKDAHIGDINNFVKNKTEFNFAKSRAILSLLWLNGHVNEIKNSTILASTVFSVLLSNIISRNYALDMKDNLTLSVITNFYYQTLFLTDIEDNILSEEQKQKMAVHTINATGAKADFVFEIIDRISMMNDVNDYIENVKMILENVRLKDFNLALLLTILKNSWYGTNSKEIISVAIEHPPTWIAIVFAALSERTFRNSMVYKIIENFGKRGKADEFLKNYTQLVKGQLSIEEIKEDLFAVLGNYE